MFGRTIPNPAGSLAESSKRRDLHLHLQLMLGTLSLRSAENSSMNSDSLARKWGVSAAKVEQLDNPGANSVGSSLAGPGTLEKEGERVIKMSYSSTKGQDSSEAFNTLLVSSASHQVQEGSMSSIVQYPGATGYERGSDLTNGQCVISLMRQQTQGGLNDAAQLERTWLACADQLRRENVLTLARGAVGYRTHHQAMGAMSEMGESPGVMSLPPRDFSPWYSLGSSCVRSFFPFHKTLFSLRQQNAYDLKLLQEDLYRSSMSRRSPSNREPFLGIDRRQAHHNEDVDRILRSRSCVSQDVLRPMSLLLREENPHVNCDSFPVKLHRLLLDLELSKVSMKGKMIASFLPDGLAFAIFDASRFESCVMKFHFPRMSHFASFQRQLNLYGFRRIAHGPMLVGGSLYVHPMFKRDHPNLCLKMKRTKIKGSRTVRTEI